MNIFPKFESEPDFKGRLGRVLFGFGFLLSLMLFLLAIYMFSTYSNQDYLAYLFASFFAYLMGRTLLYLITGD